MASTNKYELPANWKIEAVVWAASQKGMSYAQFSEAESLYDPDARNWAASTRTFRSTSTKNGRPKLD